MLLNERYNNVQIYILGIGRLGTSLFFLGWQPPRLATPWIRK